MSHVSAAEVRRCVGLLEENCVERTPKMFFAHDSHDFASQPSPGQRLGGERQPGVPDTRVRLEDLVRGMLLEVACEAVEVVQLDVAALLTQLQAVQLRVLGRTHRNSFRIAVT